MYVGKYEIMIKKKKKYYFISFYFHFSRSLSSEVRVLTITCDTDLVMSRLEAGVFSHLPHLHTLRIMGCRLQSFTQYMFQGLDSLSTLVVKNSGLEDITESSSFQHLRNLQYLDLSMNNIRRLLPDQFCGMGLREINLTANGLYNTSLMGMKPKQLEHVCIRGLVSLDLSYNFISFFDLELARVFPDLKGIMLRFSGIQRISPQVFHNLTSIEEIDLTGNLLKRISNDTFHEHPHCETLLLGHNKLTEIDIDMFAVFPSLKDANLRENRLSMISTKNTSSMNGNLEHIALSRNLIERIDQAFFKRIPVKTLKQLALSGAQVAYITQGTFKAFAQLTVLSMVFNKLTELEKNTLEGLTNLKVLHLKGNEIKTISGHAFKHCPLLEEIDLQENNLKSIPEGIFLLPNLQSVDLKNNYIEEINPDLHKSCKAAQVIRIDRRHNKWIPDWMKEITLNQFKQRMHIFSSTNQTLPPPVHSSVQTSYVKLKLFQKPDNTKEFTDLHLLLLTGVTHLYFKFSDEQRPNIVQFDLAYNRITKVGGSNYDILHMLPANDLQLSPYQNERLSNSALINLELMIQGELQCHCRTFYFKKLLSTAK